MKGVGERASREQRALLQLGAWALSTFGDLPQLALNRASAAEQASIHFIEIVT